MDCSNLLGKTLLDELECIETILRQNIEGLDGARQLSLQMVLHRKVNHLQLELFVVDNKYEHFVSAGLVAVTISKLIVVIVNFNAWI